MVVLSDPAVAVAAPKAKPATKKKEVKSGDNKRNNHK